MKKETFAENPEAQEFQKIHRKRAHQKEQEAVPELSVAESHTQIILEEQRNHILSEAQFELLLQERRAERANSSVQLLSDQLRSQCSEMSRRHVFEFGRYEQEQLRAELQSRERVNQETRLHASQELQEVRKTQNWEMKEFFRQNNGRASSL